MGDDVNVTPTPVEGSTGVPIPPSISPHKWSAKDERRVTELLIAKTEERRLIRKHEEKLAKIQKKIDKLYRKKFA